jgi:hypothetical protein
MKNVERFVLLLIIVALLVWIIFFPREKVVTQSFIKTQTDTVYQTDTHFIEKPTPVYIKSKPDTVYIESIDSSIVLETEEKVYQDSSYKLQISGFQPQLDWIELYPKTVYINTETTVETVKKQRFTHGIQAGIGYGIINKKTDLWVGYGIQYNF